VFFTANTGQLTLGNQKEKSMNAEDILQNKGYDVETTTEDVQLIDISRLLTDRRIGCVLVMDQGGSRLVGLVSERDIVSNLAQHGAEALEWPVSRVMVHNLFVCDPKSNVDSIMAAMTDNRVRHLPVMEGEKLVGLISIGDVVKHRISELESESRFMREYIATAG